MALPSNRFFDDCVTAIVIGVRLDAAAVQIGNVCRVAARRRIRLSYVICHRFAEIESNIAPMISMTMAYTLLIGRY